jgi:glucokinase
MKSVIGIDIGGTITKIGIVSKGADILKKTSFRTKDYKDFSSYTDKIHSSIININNNIEILGIGIGAPNASKNGTIETPANLNWSGNLNLVQNLKKKIKSTCFFI